MTLSTAKFPELRDRSNARLLEVVGVLDELRLPTIDGNNRREIRNAIECSNRGFNKRREIEQLASTAPQRSEYGLSQWNTDFVRLSQVEVPENFPLGVEEFRDKLWRALPNGKFKRFQELFCDPHNFVVPGGFQVDSAGKISFPDELDLKNLSVKGCLVSIDRISDEFAESLGLIKFSDRERKSPFARLKAKGDIKLVNQLKLVWDGAKSLGDRDHRVLVVQKPDDELRARYSNVRRWPAGIHGTVIYTLEDQSGRITRENPPLGPSEVRPLIPQHFSNMFSAYRRTLHVSQGYKNEQEVLVEMNGRLDLLGRRIGQHWRQGASTGQKNQMLEEVIATFTAAIDTLESVKDRNKAEAKALIGKVRDGLDSLGRRNPLVVQGRRSSAVNSLKERFQATLDKASYNERDRGILKGCLSAEGLTLQLTREAINKSGDMVSDNHLVFRPDLAEGIRAKATKLLLDEIVPHRDSLTKVYARPFSTYAGLLRIGAQELEEALIKGNLEASQKAVVRMQMVTKLCAMNVILEGIKEQLVVSEQLAIDPLLGRIKSVRDVLGSRVLPEVQETEYEEGVDSIRAGLRGLYTRLQELRERKDTLGNQGPVVRELKQLLEDIDPEEVAWELVPRKWKDGADALTEQTK